MFQVGTVDEASMRDFDASCLTAQEKIEPAQIKQIRESQHVSKSVFARYLNASTTTVERWEAGVQRPCGVALKLLGLVQKHGLKILA
jgi:putative transcriptional regulator